MSLRFNNWEVISRLGSIRSHSPCPGGLKRRNQRECYTLFFFYIVCCYSIMCIHFNREKEHTVPAHGTSFSQTCCFVAAKISPDEATSDELGVFPELIRKWGPRWRCWLKIKSLRHPFFASAVDAVMVNAGRGPGGPLRGLLWELGLSNRARQYIISSVFPTAGTESFIKE